MANREVNLTKRVQTPQGMRYCRVVLSANGRVKPDVVVVNGKEERHPEGAYYLEWREGAKRVRLSVGKDPAMLAARRQRKEAELNAVNNGVSVVPENGERASVGSSSGRRIPGRNEAHEEAEDAGRVHDCAELFHRILPQTQLEEIDRKDLLKFSAFLRDEKKQSPRASTTSLRT